jgi:sn-glycerol 3-phosphate transport system ATP-binding protein
MTMADQVVLLRAGKVEQNGAPHELYERPSTLFAARFIGTPPMNTLKLEDAGGGAVVAGSDGPALLRHSGAGLVLGVRAEAVAIGETGIPARVDAIEYLGADTLVTAAIGSERITARATGRLAAVPGDAIRVSWRPEDAHLFEGESGNRRDDLAGAMLGAASRLGLAI